MGRTTQEEKDLKAVKLDGLNLRDIKNQTEEICLTAIEQNPYALCFVKSQTVKICSAAVEKDDFTIVYVNNEFKKNQKLIEWETDTPIESRWEILDL